MCIRDSSYLSLFEILQQLAYPLDCAVVLVGFGSRFHLSKTGSFVRREYLYLRFKLIMFLEHSTGDVDNTFNKVGLRIYIAAAFWAENNMQLITAPTHIGIRFYLSNDANVVAGICIAKIGITP